MPIFIRLCLSILAALSERLSESSKFVALPNFISEKRFVRQTHALAVLLKRKYCLRIVYGAKILLSIANVLLKI